MSSKKITCSRCGTDFLEKEFYKSYSDINKFTSRISICKECVKDLFERYLKNFDGDIFQAINKLCIKTDTYYDEKLVQTSIEKSSNDISNYYYTKIALSGYKGKTYSDVKDTSVDKSKKKDTIDLDLINRWGKEYTKEDYEYLEEKYNELISVYDHRMPTQRWSYQTIVKTKLESEKALQREDYILYDKLTDRVQKLMSDSNIKPIQQDDNDDLDANLPGYWAKLIQNDEPIPTAKGKFEDADGIQKLFDRQFVKTMQKVLGVGD